MVLPPDPARRAAEEVYLHTVAKAAGTCHPLVVVDLVPMTAAARRGPLVRHPLVAFVGLAYLLSWLCWLPLLASRQGWVTWPVSPYLHLAGGLGPATAAVVVTASVSGRAGVAGLLRRCVAWRGRLRWIALAVLGPLGLFGVAVVAARLFDGEWPGLGRFGSSTEYVALPLVVYWAANVLFYGFGEEIGWRGFLQPSLQRGRSAFTAALVVALVWAAWHVPLFGITPTYRAMPRVGFVGFFLSLLVAALLLAWLYLVSDGSILVVAIFHAVFDIATTTPTATTSIPTLMGAAVTIAGLATIPRLTRVPPMDATRR
ncbi:MAG: type II CAAX endopeptidase family protein [Terracoccus sp.]